MRALEELQKKPPKLLKCLGNKGHIAHKFLLWKPFGTRTQVLGGTLLSYSLVAVFQLAALLGGYVGWTSVLANLPVVTTTTFTHFERGIVVLLAAHEWAGGTVWYDRGVPGLTAGYEVINAMDGDD
jgi:hypothetical protein